MNHDELRAICREVLESQHIDSAGADTYRSGIAIAFAAVIPEVLDELEALRTAARDTIAKIDDCADRKINFRRDFAERLREALGEPWRYPEEDSTPMTDRTSAPPPGPHYTHDCGNCTYLGDYRDESGPVDLYHCLQGDDFPTVIARYGDDGPDYASGMPFADRGMVPSLVEAKRRAVGMGLKVRIGAERKD